MNLSDRKRYIDFQVYNVTTIKGKYGFRIKLIMADGGIKFQQKSGYKTNKIANKERDKVIGELSSGKYVIEENIRLKTFLIDWLENVMRPNITDSSYKTYRNSIYKHIVPNIGNIYLNVLNSSHIQKFYDKIAKKSVPTYRIAKAVLDSSLQFALEKQLIATNPNIGVKTPKNVKKKEYRVLRIDEQKTLTKEQVKILINSARHTKIYLQVLFSTLMGLRISEVNGLKFTDVDYVTRKLKVCRQLGIKPNTNREDFDAKTYTKQEIPVKTKASNREIDIPDLVFEAILEAKRIYDANKRRRINDKTNPFQDMGYICCSSYGRPRSRGFAFQEFKRLLSENGLPNIRWHDLRHTFATILIKENFNLKAISKMMGHAKQIITADVYVDKSAIINDCTEKLEIFIQEILPEENVVVLKDYTNDTEMYVDMEALVDELTKDNFQLNDFSNEVEDYIREMDLIGARI